MVIVEVVGQKRVLIWVEQRDDLPGVEVVFGSRVSALEQQLELGCQVRQTAGCPQDRYIPATSDSLVRPVNPFGFIAAADGEIESP